MKLGASHVTVIKLSDSAETEGLRGIEVGAVMKMFDHGRGLTLH